MTEDEPLIIDEDELEDMLKACDDGENDLFSARADIRSLVAEIRRLQYADGLIDTAIAVADADRPLFRCKRAYNHDGPCSPRKD